MYVYIVCKKGNENRKNDFKFVYCLKFYLENLKKRNYLKNYIFYTRIRI